MADSPYARRRAQSPGGNGDKRLLTKKRHDRPLSASALGRSKNAHVCQIMPKGFNKDEYYKKLIDEVVGSDVSIEELEQVYIECKNSSVPNNDLRKVLKKMTKLKFRERMESEQRYARERYAAERAQAAAQQRALDERASSRRTNQSRQTNLGQQRLTIPEKSIKQEARDKADQLSFNDTVQTINVDQTLSGGIHTIKILDANQTIKIIPADHIHPQIVVTAAAGSSKQVAATAQAAKTPSSTTAANKAAFLMRTGLQSGALAKVIDAQLIGGNGPSAPQKAAVLLKRGLANGKLAEIIGSMYNSQPVGSRNKAGVLLQTGLQSGALAKIIHAQLTGGNGPSAPQKAAVLLKRGLTDGTLAKIIASM